MDTKSTNGPALAAFLAAGIGAFAMGLIVVLNEMGIFVAEMSDLVLSETSISFSLTRPERFFTSPVPLEYRDIASIPPGLLDEWSVPLVVESRAYAGSRSGGEIAIDYIRPPRVFRRRAE